MEKNVKNATDMIDMISTFKGNFDVEQEVHVTSPRKKTCNPQLGE